MHPWEVRMIVVRDGSHSNTERQSLSREAAKGRMVKPRRGTYVGRADYDRLDVAGGHVVAMRALAATSDSPVVFSHWSAGVLHGFDLMGSHLDRVHVTAPEVQPRARGVAAHLFPLCPEQVIETHGLLVTAPARTVVDIAAAAPFTDGVVTADSALRGGLPRLLLEQAADLTGPRRASSRIEDVIAFAHPGAESAAESRSRITMMRLAIEPPELQFEVFDERVFVARLDFGLDRLLAGGEVDGAKKFLDPALAKDGAGMAVYREKRREDLVRALVPRMARWGWAEACSPDRLRPVLARAGVRPAGATFTDYCVSAREWRPRVPAR